MTILVDGHIVNSGGEGIRSYLIGLYNELSKEPNVRVVIAVDDVEDAKRHFNENVEYVKLNTRNKWVRLLWDIPRISFFVKPDFVHYQYISSPFVRGKKIVTLHDVLLLRFFREYPYREVAMRAVLYYFSARTADVLITDSNFSKGEISHWFKIDSRHIHNLPLGVNFNETDGIKDVNGGNAISYILYVSRLERRKNHHGLINAYFKSEINDKMHLVLVGRDDLKYPELQDCLKNLSKDQKKKIKFLQNISTDALADLYKNASLFVFPSLSEGFGIPPLEAAYFGVPVICSNRTSLSEYNFFNDEHINTIETDEIVKRLNHFSQFGTVSYDLREVQRIVIEKYSWSRHVREFLEILSENVK